MRRASSRVSSLAAGKTRLDDRSRVRQRTLTQHGRLVPRLSRVRSASAALATLAAMRPDWAVRCSDMSELREKQTCAACA
jgi:hypothetical protein